jgi:hypothetical protein
MSSMSSMGGKGGMMSGNLPYILGGVALAGVGAYIYFRKPAATTNAAPFTQAESDACKAAVKAQDEASKLQTATVTMAALQKAEGGNMAGAMADLHAYADSIRGKYPEVATCMDRTANQFPAAIAAAKAALPPK